MLESRHCKSWSLVFECSVKPSQTITSSETKKGDLLAADCLEPPTCLVPLSKGYKCLIEWSLSRENLAQIKGHQNWVKVTGEFLTFPGGGTSLSMMFFITLTS
ncbi:hypothetical protein Peur_068265 [Populus x canadensis]